MKKYLLKILSVFTIAFITGCATNIAKLPITERDQQVYENKYIKNYLANIENGQAIRVAIMPQNPSIQGSDKGTLANLKSLTNSFGDGLESSFSNLSDFEVVPRSELGAIVTDQALTEISTGKASNFKVGNVNFIVIYRVSSYNFKEVNKLVANKDVKPSFRAYAKVKVSLINLQENVKEFTKIITGESTNASSNPTIGLLNQAIESAVKDFSTQFAVDYAPPAIVQQTKGSGQIAMLNVGKNFGLMKDMKVEFFFFKEKNGKRRVIPFAYGKILEVAEDSSWVKVNDFETAGVKENHFARVRKDQSKSLLEKADLPLPLPLALN